MFRYGLRVTLLLDRPIDRPERSVERVISRVAAILPDAQRSSGMTAVDGFATALHVEHTITAAHDAEHLQALLALQLGGAFQDALRAPPVVAVTLLQAGRPAGDAPPTRFSDGRLRDAAIAATATPAPRPADDAAAAAATP